MKIVDTILLLRNWRVYMVRSACLSTLLFLQSHDCFAHNFCVASAADLQSALTQCSDMGTYNGEDNLVLLEPGTYSTANNGGLRFYYRSTAAHYLDMQGGWSDNCTSFTTDPKLSLLDGHHDNAVLEIHSASGSVSVRNLTIQNGVWQNANLSGGLTINPASGDLGFSSVSYTIIKNNQATSMPGGIFGGNGGIFMINNLLFGNSTDGNGGAGKIASSQGIFITNNTIANNMATGATATGGLVVGGSGPGYMTNNIIWNNAHVGIELLGNTIVLVDNDYGVLGGVGTPAAGSAGNISINPQFIDGSSNNYRLSGSSPAIAAGMSSPQGGLPGIDLDGRSRPLYGPVDLGAYEETIFLDSFEAD